MKGRAAAILIGVVLLASLAVATGWVEVAPGEVVVVRRLGRALPAPWLPGPHLGWPLGLDQRTRVRIDEVRRLEAGLAGAPGVNDESSAGEFLTADRNLLRARAVIEYRVADPITFVVRTAALDVEPLLVRLGESSVARALAQHGIDGALRLERAGIARDVEADLARTVDTLGLGIAILGVRLTDARPPGEVAPDFAAAQAAQSEHDRRVQEARTYAITTATAATAEARARLDRARARADRAVVLARSRADRFLALLDQADRARGLTVRRLYLETLRDLWPRVKRKLVLAGEDAVDLSILGLP